MTLALLCSGQGPQHPDMFALTGDGEASDLFDHAASLLGGRDPRDMVRSETDDALHDNRTGQILCTLQPLAAAASLDIARHGGLIVAGYSVGEVAAWGVVGLIDPKGVLDLVAHRAEAMGAATKPGDGMLFVRGLPRSRIDILCERHGAAVAIVNPGDGFALGGDVTALEGLAADAAQEGAERVVRIGVKVASHTARLASASVRFRRCLDVAVVRRRLPEGVRLLSGIDGAPVLAIGTGLDKLAQQISTTVQWSDCLAACIEAGTSAFLELGPGRALAEMAASAYPGIPARSLDDFKTLAGVETWLSRTGQ